MIVKDYPSAFVKTELEIILSEQGVNTLFLGGLSATPCVLAAHFGTQERDYNVSMVEGAVIGSSADHSEPLRRGGLSQARIR